MFGLRRDTFRNKLAGIWNKELFNECLEFITRFKHTRHFKTLTRQLSKFDRLQHKYNGGFFLYTWMNHHIDVCSYTRHNVNTYNSNIQNKNNHVGDNNIGNNNSNSGDRYNDNTKEKWVINMYSTHLTEVQIVSGQGPQFCDGP